MASTVPEIKVNYKKIQKGYVAQCQDNPQFIVQAEKKNQIEEKISDMVKGYVTAFPEERNMILPDGKIDFKITLQPENVFA